MAKEEVTRESIEQRLSDNAEDFDSIIVDMLALIILQEKQLEHYRLTAGY